MKGFQEGIISLQKWPSNHTANYWGGCVCLHVATSATYALAGANTHRCCIAALILPTAVAYRHHTLVASVWNQRINVVKRINKET